MKPSRMLLNMLPHAIEKVAVDNAVFLRDLWNNPFKTAMYLQEVKKNVFYKNLHKNKRCFILCTGPSINKQKIELLKNEIVFAVSTGFYHEKYKIIHPKYHIYPKFEYNKTFTIQVVAEFFEELEKWSYYDTEYFFDIHEKDLIIKGGFFKDRKVNFVYFNGGWGDTKEIYSVHKFLPGIQSVPIMGIMLAMYMGFKEIYLLGTEHNELVTNQYKHAFWARLGEETNYTTDENGQVIVPKVESLRCIYNLFYQYKILHQIADHNGITIMNATLGGFLDEFPRIEFEKLFN